MYPFICSDFSLCQIIRTQLHSYSFPCEIIPNLFLGPAPPIGKELIFLKGIEFTHVLNMAVEINYAKPRGITYKHILIDDDPHAKLPITAINRFLFEALGLTHCIPPPTITSSRSQTVGTDS
jgi:hypothetical protein